MESGFIFDIKRFALHDGPGIRTTVFLKGCPLSCLGCHNPEGQRLGPELLFRQDRCTWCGDCVEACPNNAISVAHGAIRIDPDHCHLTGACGGVCLPGALELVGRSRSVGEVLEILERDRIYFEESGGGVTFSGGEPFAQPDFLEGLLLGCRDREIPVVLDTCGHAAPETFRRLAPLAREILFDLKLMDPGAHEAFTGIRNRWILENLEWVGHGCREEPRKRGRSTGSASGESRSDPDCEGGASCPFLTIRIPLVPEVNDHIENLRDTAGFLLSLERIPPVDLLPYHMLGVDKYHRMGKEYHLTRVSPPGQERVRRATQILRDAGLEVTVRGESHDHD